MCPRKSSKKEIKEKNSEAKTKKAREEDDELNDDLNDGLSEEFKMYDDDDYVEEDEGIEEIDEEDEEEEFLNHIKEYDKQHKSNKMVNVYEKLGKPKYKKLNEVNEADLKDEYKNLVCLLDQHNIIVHFQNDYSYREKYRFITEEIFKQDVEDFKKSNIHVNFIYEDFHPEMLMGDEEDDEIY
jgi:hypothetical protein